MWFLSIALPWPPIYEEKNELAQQIPPFQEYLTNTCGLSTIHQASLEPGTSAPPPLKAHPHIQLLEPSIIPYEIGSPGLKLIATSKAMAHQFWACQNDEIGRRSAHQCARILAFSLPKEILEVISKAYRNRMLSGGELGTIGPPEGRGKERVHY